MKFSSVFALSLIPILFMACGTKSSSVASTSGASQESSSNDLNANHVQSSDGSVQVDRNELNPAQLAQVRNEYRRANLVQLPLDAKYNANVFRITDESVDDYKNKAFIAPKLYCYGTQDGGKLAPYRHSDGTVTLSFNVIFFDGIQEEAMSPDGNSSIRVPKLFAVQEKTDLENELRTRYGTNNGLAPLPGCPKSLILTAAGREYDATPASLARGDFCQLNVPITVALTVPEADAKLIMDIGLATHTVDLQGTYETKVSYPTSTVTVKFNRSKIYNELKAELGTKPWFLDVDVKAAITKVIQHQLMTVVIQGDPSEYAYKLMSQVSDQFFESFAPNPGSPDAPACSGSATVCLRFSTTQMEQSSDMTFTFAEETNLLSGQNYITSTKLKATPNTVTIGKDCDENGLTTIGNCQRLTSGGAPRETGLTVIDGNHIKVEPSYMVLQRLTVLAPQTTRVNNSVCVREHTECDFSRCHGSTCRDSGIDSRSETQACHTVCDYENHWSDITDFGSHPVSDERIPAPTGQLAQLYDGLAFQFRWHDQSANQERTLECPLSSFPREGDGRSLDVQVMNMPNCKPFTGVQGETPMLYLVNHIDFPQSYLIGRDVVSWDGVVSETHSSSVFNPKVDFAGSLTIMGYSFESAATGGTH